jgi:hypothetical protein
VGVLATYFDSSALVKLFLAEPGWEQARQLWDESETVSSWVALPETRSALEAAHRAGRIGRSRLLEALGELDEYWDEVVAVKVDADLARAAGALTRRHPLRGGDAIHLASAVEVDDPELVFVAWDDALRRAALAEGFPVAPT